MSTALELPLFGKTKENDKEEEEKVEEGATAIGGPSKKASRVVGSEGDDKEELPWRVRVPLKYVPKVSPKWMVVCKSCGNERFYTENCACSCGYHFGSEGDDKEEEEKVISCSICCSNSPKAHRSDCCPWRVRIPLNFVPEVSPKWMVVCKSCGNERFHTENCACSSCGYHVMYVMAKSCVACMLRGHLDNKDPACKYYGKTREDDPFHKRVKRMLEKLALDPECP